LIQCNTSADYLSENVAGCCGPNGRLLFFIVCSDVFFDGSLQFSYADEHSAADALFGDVAKKSSTLMIQERWWA